MQLQYFPFYIWCFKLGNVRGNLTRRETLIPCGKGVNRTGPKANKTRPEGFCKQAKGDGFMDWEGGKVALVFS